MRAADFVAKWRADAPGHELNERAGAQTHQTLDTSVAAAYGFADYSAGFTLMLAWLVAGLAVLAFARETHAKQVA